MKKNFLRTFFDFLVSLNARSRYAWLLRLMHIIILFAK